MVSLYSRDSMYLRDINSSIYMYVCILSLGGRYFARGLRENDSLLYLNLRLNRLTDEGCNLLLEGLRDNVSLINLNIASNGAGAQVPLVITIID